MLFRSIVGTYWRVLLALRVETLFRSIVGTYWRVLGFSFSMGKMTEPTLSVLQHLLEQAGEHDIPNLYVYVHVYIYTHTYKYYMCVWRNPCSLSWSLVAHRNPSTKPFTRIPQIGILFALKS